MSARWWVIDGDGSGARAVTPADTYDEEVAAIVDGFQYEACPQCGRDLGEHVISPDPLGHAHAWCQR